MLRYVGAFIFCQYRLTVWGYSSAGRAPALQAGGQRFDPAYLHQTVIKVAGTLIRAIGT